jgi:hypothetical protein
MLFRTFMDIIKQALEYIDLHTNTINTVTYRNIGPVNCEPSVHSLKEGQLVEEIRSYLSNYHINFPASNVVFSNIVINNRYPSNGGRNVKKVDLEFTTNNEKWIVEFKKFNMIGNNGKQNDYGIQKALSPFPIHRSFLGDFVYLKSLKDSLNNPDYKYAVIAIGFDYPQDPPPTIGSYLHSPTLPYTVQERIQNVNKVCDLNLGNYKVTTIYQQFGLFINSNYENMNNIIEHDFYAKSKHPCSGEGKLFGVEIL